MKNVFLFSVMMFVALNLSAQKRSIHSPKANKTKQVKGGTINVEVESSDDDTVVNWMVDPVGKKSRSINGVDINQTYKTYSIRKGKEIFCTVNCSFCKKSTVFEKNGNQYNQIAVNTKTKKVVRYGNSKIVEKNGKYSYEGNACCPARKKQFANGVAHENVWESRM